MNKMNKFILGIDAGATKTTAIIIDENENILGRGEAGPANFHVNTKEEISKNVADAFTKAISETGEEVKEFTSACLGGAGIDTPEILRTAENIVKDVIPVTNKENMLVVNDTKVVLPACSQNDHGIVVIAGTGSNFYGKNKEGKEAWVGGLDYILSDEGSAYSVGLKVLRAAVKSADGRGPKTILEDLVLGKFHIESVRDLADIVYKDDFKKQNIAEISILADEAYRRGDMVAEDILSESALELAKGITAVAKKLEMEKDEFEIIVIGGKFNSPYPFDEKIVADLKLKKANLLVCHTDPAFGAARLALSAIKG